jgi:hypothetical protein
MDSWEIDLPEGYLTVRVPGGIVVISAGLVDTRTETTGCGPWMSSPLTASRVRPRCAA